MDKIMTIWIEIIVFIQLNSIMRHKDSRTSLIGTLIFGFIFVILFIDILKLFHVGGI